MTDETWHSNKGKNWEGEEEATSTKEVTESKLTGNVNFQFKFAL